MNARNLYCRLVKERMKLGTQLATPATNYGLIYLYTKTIDNYKSIKACISVNSKNCPALFTFFFLTCMCQFEYDSFNRNKMRCRYHKVADKWD